MKEIKSKWNEYYYKIATWTGSVILIITGFFLMVGKTIDYNLSISALIGIMIIITSFFSYIGMDKPKDERLMKIGTYSATYSWYITLGFVSFLVFTGYNAHREFKGPEMLGLTILVMVSTMLVINTILNLKGDVE